MSLTLTKNNKEKVSKINVDTKKMLRNLIEQKEYSNMNLIWDKVFKDGPSKICGRKPLTTSLQIFKGCLLQILLGPFLNTLPHITLKDKIPGFPHKKNLSINQSFEIRYRKN